MRIKALVIRIMRQFFRDKRTLGMIIVAPMFILWLVSLVFSGEKIEPTLGIVSENDRVIEKFDQAILYDQEEEALSDLVNGKLHGYIIIGETPPKIVIEGSDPTINKIALQIFQNVLQNIQTPVKQEMKTEVTYYYGSENMTTFDNIGPFIIAYFIFFFVFIISGVSFLRERTSGTLEKLLSTPLKRWEIVIGYVIGFGFFTSLQTVVIVYFSINVLDLMMSGSILLVMLVTLALSITALTLGTFLSAFARNELQMFQFIPIVIIPQIFFAGLFNIEGMPQWLKSLSVFMPLTYGGEAMRDIMIRGRGLADIGVDLVILMSFSIAFMFLNNFALKKHRKV